MSAARSALREKRASALEALKAKRNGLNAPKKVRRVQVQAGEAVVSWN